LLFNYQLVLSLSILLSFTSEISAKQNVFENQDTLHIKASDKAEHLLNEKKYSELAEFCKKEITKNLNQKVKDSSEISWLNYYHFEAQSHFGDYLESLKSAEQGIQYCKNNDEGLQQKAILFYKKAYTEKVLNFPKRSFTSMEMSSRLLSQLEEPNFDYAIGAYNFLSQEAAYHGDLEKAQRYLRLSEKLYLENKDLADNARAETDGNDRYEVIIPYKNIYVLYKLGQTTSDSLQIESNIKTLIELEKQPEFSPKYESIYYSTALNHVGSWYLTHKPEDSLTAIDFQKAN
jgi:hypothetical protein